jgi:phosphoribosylformylglycinamidine cyclo-ligase
VGAVEKSQLLDGSQVRAGDVLVGIASSGPHSNGYSLIRRILERAGFERAGLARAGLEGAGAPLGVDLGGVTLEDALMAPTALYVKPVLDLLRTHGGSAGGLHAMAHITGGGLTENIIRVVPDGLGLEIAASSWTPPPVFEWLQREGAVSRAEMWRTFNCGVGFVLVASPAAVASLESGLDGHGLQHWRIGEVVTARGGERVHIG